MQRDADFHRRLPELSLAYNGGKDCLVLLVLYLCAMHKAILVGTRRTDPHGEHLKHFDPTDNSWPAFVRVHPVIDWHYVDIWTVSVLKKLQVVAILITAVYTILEHPILSAI